MAISFRISFRILTLHCLFSCWSVSKQWQKMSVSLTQQNNIWVSHPERDDRGKWPPYEYGLLSRYLYKKSNIVQYIPTPETWKSPDFSYLFNLNFIFSLSDQSLEKAFCNYTLLSVICCDNQYCWWVFLSVITIKMFHLKSNLLKYCIF